MAQETHHHHGFRIKGAWARTKLEYAYWTCRDWPITDVGDFWDSVTDYDDINEETYTYFRRFTDGDQISTIPANSHVLEVTPRTGNGILYFYQQGKIAKADLADVSDFQMDICRKNLTKHGVPFTTVKLTDYSFPYEDNRFDAVLSFETVEHMGSPETFVAEIGRVLKPGGELLLSCPNIVWEPIHWFAAIFELHHSEGPHNFPTRRQLHTWFERAALEIEEEICTILIPGGPRWLTGFGEWLEQWLPKVVVRSLGLRRIFRCRKRVETS
ncbi:MAG: class I SAM-dependent methyltransferase [Mariprofundaceae bacterium]